MLLCLLGPLPSAAEPYMLRLAQAARLFAPGSSLITAAPRALNVPAMRSARTNSGGNIAGATAPAACGAPLPAAGTVASAAEQQQEQQGRVRDYPDEPRVGVGVVVLRQLPPAGQPEVLLIRRAKEPAKGAAAWREGGGQQGSAEAKAVPAVCDVAWRPLSAALPLRAWRTLDTPEDIEPPPLLPPLLPLLLPLLLPPLLSLLPLLPPAGLWCFPGGSLELGETLVDCAVRETLEETGLQLRNAPIPEGMAYPGGATALIPYPPHHCRCPCAVPCRAAGELFSESLEFPTPIAAADSLTQDASGRLLFHYAIINLAAIPQVGWGPGAPAGGKLRTPGAAHDSANAAGVAVSPPPQLLLHCSAVCAFSTRVPALGARRRTRTRSQCQQMTWTARNGSLWRSCGA